LTQVLDLHRRRLWHQLTGKLEEFVHPDKMRDNIDLVQFYTSFIKTFEQRLNQLSLVRICVNIAHQIPTASTKVEFIQNISKLPKVVETPEAVITAKVNIAEYHLANNNLESSKELLNEAKATLDVTAGIESAVYSTYHHAWALYYIIKQEPENFFASALSYLGYTKLEQIPESERAGLAFNMGVAALLGEKIYNFGEFINHPILENMAPDRKWLVEVLRVFYAGNIREWVALKSKYHTELNKPEFGLVAKAHVLEDKIAILSFLELVFTKTGQDRKISFEDISKATLTDPNKVELLVMRALSVGLIKGTLDEVDHVVYVSWVQPRLLLPSQIGTMANKFSEWTEKVRNSLTLLENQMTPELIS